MPSVAGSSWTRRTLAPVLAAVAMAASAHEARPAPPSVLAEAARAAATLPRLHSLLVSRRGELLLEHYAPGMRRSRLANVKSVSKSVIAVLVGIALDRRVDRAPRRAARRRSSRVEPDSGPPQASDHDRGPGQHAVGPRVHERPALRSVGQEPRLGGVRAAAAARQSSGHGRWSTARGAGTCSRRFSRRCLVSTPGSSRRARSASPRDQLRAMAARPARHLLRRQRHAADAATDGRDRRALPERGARRRATGASLADWVEPVLHPAGGLALGSRDAEYGYGWWIDDLGGRQACYAWGFGGQFIFVFRDLDLVVVTTSSTDTSDERWDYRDRLLALVEEHIVGRLATAVPRPPALP